MKATHLRTPRTLDECRFESDAQAIWKIDKTGMEDFETIKSTAFILGGFALFLIILYIFKL